MNKQKNLLATAIAVSLAGLAAGVILGTIGWPVLAARLEYVGNTTPITKISTKLIHAFDGVPDHDARITVNTTVMEVFHSFAGIPLHKHVITVVTTTNETTPDGKFYDFQPMKLPSGNNTATEIVASKDLVFSQLIALPTEVSPREFISVKVNVTNTGMERGPFIIPLNVDGANFDKQSITLSPGASQDVEFTIRIFSTGWHVISVGDQQVDVGVGVGVGG